MEAIEIIEYLREQNFTVKADGDFLELSPPEELIKRLRKHKPAILAELKREERRLKVLAMLAEKPDSQRAIIADTEADPQHVIVTVALRGQYSFELKIPQYKYDAFLMLELIEKGSLQ